MDNIKLNEMMLQAINTYRSYKLINSIGKSTINHEKHNEEKAVKAFYNIATRVKDIINKEHCGNLQFSRGEKKEFAKMLYNHYMNG